MPELFRQVFHSFPDAVLLIQAGRVVAANPASAQLFAAESERELEGRELLDLFHPDFHRTLSHRIEHLLSTGAPVPTVAERIVRFDGEVRDIETSTGMLARSGETRVLLSLRDVTERMKVEAALALTAEQLRALSAHEGTLVEEERKRIAREIHDELGQQLTYAKLRIALEGYAEAAEAISSAIRTVRRISTELRPPLLDSVGLTAAVEWQARSFQESTGIVARLERLEEFDPGPDQSIALFRILQEALTNAARHSGAKEVCVSLYQDEGRAVLRVADDGKGMHAGTAEGPAPLGILGMRERAGLLGGSLEIESAPGAGTTLRIVMPIRTRREEA